MAKVSKTPGKTRALNFFLINDRFYFVDLPGYGYAKVSKGMRADWDKLIQDYLEQSQRLAGLALLLDSRRDPTDEDLQLMAWMAERGIPALVALTKVDKLTRDKMNRKIRQIENDFGLTVIPFSSVTGVGKRELMAAVEELVAENITLKK